MCSKSSSIDILQTSRRLLLAVLTKFLLGSAMLALPGVAHPIHAQQRSGQTKQLNGAFQHHHLRRKDQTQAALLIIRCAILVTNYV